MLYRCLLIGCGNIGGLYDLGSDLVLTWAKALSRDPETSFEVYDADAAKARTVAEHYGVLALPALDAEALRSRDLVVIATPTHSHAALLEQVLAARPGLVAVEKPVAADLSQLDRIEAAYRDAGCRVLVNFHRRFQPGFARAREAVSRAEAVEPCTSIIVKYQRGLHNNASHALDLLEYLFGRAVPLDGAALSLAEEDEIPGDPTASLTIRWGGTQVALVGLPRLKAAHFEIEIYFGSRAIVICNGGDTVRYLSTHVPATGHYMMFSTEHEETCVNSNYMVTVLDHVKAMLGDGEMKDNFLSAVDTSRRILTLKVQ